MDQRNVCRVVLLLVMGWSGCAAAQNQTQGQRELAEDIRDMRARNAAAASAADAQAKYADASARAAADAAALRRMRETEPERLAAQRALNNARAQEIAAQDRALHEMIRQGMLDEQRRVKLVEFERLKEHPLPVAAPGSYTECDALASAPYDQTRPLGLTGVTQQELNTGAAIAACREELQKHPDSARSTFELARALLIDGRCDEGLLTSKEAILKGSAAAAVLYGLLPNNKCKDYAKLGDMEKYFKMAEEMGSGDGAWFLNKYYSDEGLRKDITHEQSVALFTKAIAAEKVAYQLLQSRAIWMR